MGHCDANIVRYPALSTATIVLGLWVMVWSVIYFYDNVCRKKSAKMLAKESKKDVKTIRLTSLLSLGLYTINYLTFVVGCFVTCKQNRHDFFALGCTINGMATLAVLAIFAFRLYFTFNNTHLFSAEFPFFLLSGCNFFSNSRSFCYLLALCLSCC